MSWIAVGLGVAAVVGWFVYRVRANARLERPPIRDRSGTPYPARAITLSDGTSVNLIDVGSGPVVLLLPGADGMKETWRYQVPALASAHRVLAPDLRTVFPDDMEFERLAADARDVLDAAEVPAAHVVGQSLGGAIALQLAIDEPDRVESLVIVNSLARVAYDHVGLNRVLLVPVAMFATRYLPTALARTVAWLWSRLAVWVFDNSNGRERVIDYVLWTGPRTVPPRISSARVDLLKGRDLRPALPGIDAPALVVKGERDSYVPVAWSEDIARRLARGRYVTIPETGHVSHISMPDEFNRILLDWLEEHGSIGAKEAEG